jgi:DNA-binding MarR family transcriptional regulator
LKHYTKDNYHPADSVGFLLSKARNVVMRDMDAALKVVEITAQQMGIILYIGRGEVNTPFELSKLLEIDSGLMTRMLDKLEKADLLVRTRSTDDRRIVNLQLTEKGLQLTKEIPKIAPEVLNDRLKDFTQDEFKELQRLLRKFVNA